MNPYTPNPTCQCPRCRARGLMGPSILITIGVIFLLDQVGSINIGETFPIFLIVVGVMLYLGRTASLEGHVQPPLIPTVTGPPMPPPPPAPGTPSHGPEVNS